MADLLEILMSLPRLLRAIVLLASVSLGLSAADSKAAGGTATFTLPFELIDNRVFIEVRLNGKGPSTSFSTLARSPI